MRIGIMIFAWAVAAAGAAAMAQASGPATDRASVFATIGHSEWCRPGTVWLNLGTGRYMITAPPRWRTCRRPAFRARLRTGVLAAGDLGSVRAAWQSAETEGLEHPSCRNGGQPEGVYLSNGGDPTLRLTSRGRTQSPPDNRSCWSQAAFRLHRLLERLFDPGTDRRR